MEHFQRCFIFLILDIFTNRATFGLYTYKYIKCISNCQKNIKVKKLIFKVYFRNVKENKEQFFF